MQLDTAIEQRKREINNVSNDINNEKEQNETGSTAARQKKIDMLNTQLDRANRLYADRRDKLMADRYSEIATSKLYSLHFN